MSSWRAALRVARREARRARGRSALVVAMIALPVAGLAFAAVQYDTFTLSPEERATRLMGAGQAVVGWPADSPVQQEPTELDLTDVSESRDGTDAGSGPERSTAGLLTVLPPGSRAITDQDGLLSVRTVAGTGTVGARLLDYADPIAAGVVRPLAGRAPAAADEVALTPAASRRTGAGVGGTVRLADGSRTFRVVGLVEDPNDLDATTIVLRPGAVPDTVLGATGGSAAPASRTRWLVATPGPLTWADVKQLNTHGMVAVSRYVLAHPPSAAERYPRPNRDQGPELGILLLVGGLALLEVVLLAGPAFAVGARRRRRELALVAAAGGTPAQLRRIVLADGVVLGALAAAGGIVLGVAAAAAARPLIEEHLASERSGAFRVYPLALAVVAGLAVVTGLLAALVPAWTAARQDVVAALAGRRGITRSRRRWTVLGLVLVGAGAGIAALGAWQVDATVIIAGLAVVELGLVLTTPALVGLVARAGRWLPLPTRIALRNTSRNRTAAAPAISAVMAAVIGSMAIAVIAAAENERARRDYRIAGQAGDVYLFPGGKIQPGLTVPPEAVTALRATMPVTGIHQLNMLSCDQQQPCVVEPQLPRADECPYAYPLLRREPTPAEQRAARREPRCIERDRTYDYFGAGRSNTGMTFVVDPDAVGVVTGVPAADATAAAAALRAGKVVVDDPRLFAGGRVTMAITSLEIVGNEGRPGDTRTVPAPGHLLAHRARAPITLLTAATARSLGLTVRPFVTVATTSRMPSEEEQDRLRAALGDSLIAYVERGAGPVDPAALMVLAIVAGVITLGAAAIATGLAAADGRAELGTLAAVGAAPRVRRLLSLSQSGVIAGLGSVLGVVAGLGASVAVLVALNQRSAGRWPAPTPYPITVPWLNVGIALLVVPLVAMLGAGLLTRSRLPIERRGT